MFDVVPSEVWPLALGGGVTAAGGALVGHWVRRWSLRRRIQRRAQRAIQGERGAVALLAQHGYTVLEEQARASYVLELGAERVDVNLRADFLVQAGEEVLVAEVKTGALATRIDHPATRRQLLEYAMAFQADGVLLVDADAKTVAACRWPTQPASQVSRTSTWLLVLAFAGGALVSWFVR